MRHYKLLVILLATILIPAAFAAAQSSPYRFRTGDTLDISVWQEPKLNRQVVIAPDGTISVPLAGRIKAGGVTAQTIESSLKQRLSKQYKTELDITVSLLAQRKLEAKKEPKKIERFIYVTGEVNKPGAFKLETTTTVLQAIALSGGLSPFAAKKRILVRRQSNGISQTFNYRAAEDGYRIEGNIVLRPGDVVVVPERGIFE